MITPSIQLIKKTALWGIPLVILIILIVLLLLELTDKSQEEVTALSESGISVPRSTAVQDDIGDTQSVIFDSSESTEPEEGQMIIEGLSDQQALVEEEVATEDQAPYDPESENSYIVEEGDNLWKIAEKHDAVNDPWQWKTILIQNRDKINYTIVSADTGKWKVMIDPGRRLIVKPKETEKTSTSFNKSRKKRFALQLMSLNLDQLETAIDIVKLLIKDDYYAYLYRTREKIRSQSTGTLQYFYRIRVGFFTTESEAKNIGAEILERHREKMIFSDEYWAVLPSYRELSGELIDFGIQRTKPWIIQVAERENRADAISDLSKLTSLVEFSYISQKKNPERGYQYRIRAGFYETKADAQAALAAIQSQSQDQFTNPKIFETHHVMESAPGQSTGETTFSKIKGKPE